MHLCTQIHICSSPRPRRWERSQIEGLRPGQTRVADSGVATISAARSKNLVLNNKLPWKHWWIGQNLYKPYGTTDFSICLVLTI